MQTTRIQKLITFSPDLYQMALIKAKSLGLSFADYLRHILVKEIEEEKYDFVRLKMLAKEGLAEYKAGKTKSISTPRELKAYLKEIEKAAKK